MPLICIYQGKMTQGKHVIRSNGPDTRKGENRYTKVILKKLYMNIDYRKTGIG